MAGGRVVFSSGGHRFGVFICYEEIFGDEISLFVMQGAQVLVNISDDGWYGRHLRTVANAEYVAHASGGKSPLVAARHQYRRDHDYRSLRTADGQRSTPRPDLAGRRSAIAMI